MSVATITEWRLTLRQVRNALPHYTNPKLEILRRGQLHGPSPNYNRPYSPLERGQLVGSFRACNPFRGQSL